MPRIKVYRQAELDYLCGLYCVLNAARHLSTKAQKADPGKLFEFLVRELDNLMSLADALCDGIRLPKLRKLACAASDEFGGFSVTSLKKYAASGGHSDIVEVSRSACSTGGIVLCHLDHPEKHWTLLKRASGEALSLIDSAGFPRKIKTQALERGDYEINNSEGLVFLPA